MTGAAKPKRGGKRYRVLWICAVLFFVGYVPTIVTESPVASMAAVTLLAIPAGSAAPTVRKGLVRGALMGLVAGMTITIALHNIALDQIRKNPPATLPATTRKGVRSLFSPQAATGPSSPRASQETPKKAPDPFSTGPTTATSQPTTMVWRLVPKWTLTDRHVAAYVGSMVFMCGAVGALFAHIRARRRKLIEEQWR